MKAEVWSHAKDGWKLRTMPLGSNVKGLKLKANSIWISPIEIDIALERSSPDQLRKYLREIMIATRKD